MPATVATITPGLKEVWTADQFENQLYVGDPFLDRIERTNRYTIGEYAVTPILTNRPGGYSVTDKTGSTALNAAGNTGTAQAQWPYVYHWQQVKLDIPAIVQTEGGNTKSIAAIADLEMEQANQAMRKQITRQTFTNGDALIAQCTTSASGNVVSLLSTGYGPDALKRRWLHKGQVVDIGTTSNEVSQFDAVTITAVDPVNNTITVTGSAATTSSSHYVSIANARAGTTSLEMNGLLNLVKTSGTIGGVDPTVESEWAAATGAVDTTTTDITLPALDIVNATVQQQTGNGFTDCITSYKQARKFYELLQLQVRFTQDRVAAGSTDAIEFAGMKIQRHVDCPDRQWWFLNLPDFFIVARSKPFWVDEITGGARMPWNQGTTNVVSLLGYPINLVLSRRNSHGAFTALTAA